MPIPSLILIQISSSIAPGTWLPLLVPLIIIELALLVVALIDLIRRDPHQVRGNKVAWGLIIVLVSTFGPICYLLIGRKEEIDVHS